MITVPGPGKLTLIREPGKLTGREHASPNTPHMPELTYITSNAVVAVRPVGDGTS